MPKNFLISGFLALAMAACMALSPAAASDKVIGTPDTPAGKFVQRMGDKALGSLTDRELSPKEREKRVRDLLRTHFDVNSIGRFTLGKHWPKATAEERSEYLKLFEDMIVKTYSQRFSEYSGQKLKIGATKKPPSTKDVFVSSQILQQDGPPVNIDWRIRGEEGKMKVVDVIVEGVSMLATQRCDFDAVIQKGGGKIEALLASLRDRKDTAAKK